jgi:hypothetical protein
MGFMNGRVSYVRFRVPTETIALPFGPEHLELVEKNAIGSYGPAEATDGVTVGWAGGEHVLDTTFDLAKNVLDDALHLAIRVDTDKIPGELLRAYTRIELDARAAGNPSGRPTKAQKEEAKEAALARAQAEAADGRYRRSRQYPVLWDVRQGVLYSGATSAAVLDKLLPLFRDTFGPMPEPVSAGRLASEQAEAKGLGAAVDNLLPLAFTGEDQATSVVWTESDPSSRDFTGNEFLVWLWHTLQNDGDTIHLADGSEVSVMLSKTLTLDCPLGQSGSDSLKDEGPSRLPEAFRALQSGKLPRKSGMRFVRQGQDYEFVLQAETLNISGLALPKLEGARGDELRWGRVESLRHFAETLDLLFDAFATRRIGAEWSSDLGRIRRWLTTAAA